MKLSTKLITLFLLIGVIPAGIIGTIALVTASKDMKDQKKVTFGTLNAVREIKKAQIETYFHEREGDMEVLANTVGTLRKESFDKLTAIRETKKAEVERYFQDINGQILTFSEDRMIVDAMRQFGESFRQFRAENNVTQIELDRMRMELSTYYTGPFSTQYQKQNNGRSPNAKQFFNRLDDDSIALQYQYIQANQNPLGSKHLLDHSDDLSRYSKLHAQIHPIVRNYLDKFGYYDIFLVDAASGDIVYSVFKELDYSTSLIDGPYAKTNFGEAFRRAVSARNKDAVILTDYASYTPSYEAPAGFIASPIFDGNELIGVAMFQLPIDRLNAIMAERAGIGETGETYLVGPDKLMRSDSYLDPGHHSVLASFTNPKDGTVETAAATAALAGETGAQVIIDYNGNPVLSAYAPVSVGGLTWAILAEIDVAEAFCPKNKNGEYFFEQYAKAYGYYDLFLLNPDGYCFFSAAHEADEKTNLATGKFKDSGLGKLVRKTMESKKYGVQDFEPYAPSNGAPAAFIARPVLSPNGNVELIVALQLPIEAINKIMQVRVGMGETGESYLVGPDKRMRSDSFLDKTGHSVMASFAGTVKQNGVDTEASREALAGKADNKIIMDYNGNPVLSSYTSVTVGNTTWALIAEVDEAEAYAGLSRLKSVLGVIGTVALVAIALIAVLVSRSITKPIGSIILNLSSGAAQVAAAAEQVAAGSQAQAEGASEQAAGLEETSSSLEEMSSMIELSSGNAQQANSLATGARKAADSGAKSMGRMNQAITEIQKSSNETAKIIKVIDEIAFQTNLLALNAAVEAARAGEAGKGFAVVAEEVRNLAMRSAEAAKNTSHLIEESVKNANNGVAISGEVSAVLDEIVSSVGKTTDLVSEIATASHEQAEGINQVNIAVQQMDKVTLTNAANAEESASAAEELRAQAEATNQSVQELAALVGGTSEGHLSSRVKTASHHLQDRVKHVVPAAGHHRSNAKQGGHANPFDDEIDAFNA